jgi:opacity protein-like surface antigen
MLAALPVRSSFPFGVFLGMFVATTVYATSAVAVENATAETDATEPDEESTEPDTAEENNEQPVASSKEKKADDGSKGTSHKGQFSLRLAGVAAYRVVMRYDESPLCAAPEPDGEPKKFCGFSAPMGLDTALGYAPLPGVEPFLWGRFGFASESKTHTAPLLVFGAGVRLYTMSDAPFKFFIEPSIGAELEGRASGATNATGTSSAYKQDWLVRLSIGPQYDFNRYIGLYAAGGMTFGMVRALHTFMELQFGLQARIP